jgi:hypothetical protein
MEPVLHRGQVGEVVRGEDFALRAMAFAFEVPLAEQRLGVVWVYLD